MFSLTKKNRLWVATYVGLGVTALYALVGALTVRMPARHVPLTVVDSMVPFLPWTFWIYGSVYFIYAASCILQDDLFRLRVFLYAYLLATVVSSLIFLALPTTYPREPFPVDPSGWTGAALTWFRLIDPPTNCFPSMHVGSATLATLAFYPTRKKTFWFFSCWTLLIAIGTLTTKQHYFADVLGGLTLALACHRAALAYLQRSTTRSRSASFT